MIIDSNTTKEAAMSVTTGASRCETLATLCDDERQRCEVWTRVMGYHRPVASFNIGKKGEHAQRRFFREDRAAPR
jgi:anaerobic ribonucleoside-triphosphate reductase